MRRRPRPLHRTAVLVRFVLAVGAASTGCGLVPPSPESARVVQAPAPPPRPTTSLLLRVGERRLYLMDDDPATPVESFPIAVGRPGHETPTGRFRVEEKIEHPDFNQIDPHDRTRVLKRIPPGPANPLGQRWIGIVLGDGWTVGIHGTPSPELLGRAVSKGCIRMRNEDVIHVYDRVQIGTPVLVEP